MPFAGLDLHKQVIEAAIVDEEGKLVHKSRFPATREALAAFARRWLNPETRVAVEATTNTWAVVDVLEPLVGEVVVSNPMRTRAIASAKIMTDAISAPTLAHLLRLNYLPRVWQPDATTRHQRELVTERTTLTVDRTRIKNRIHSVLHQRMISAPEGDLFNEQNLKWLRALPVSEEGLNENGRRVLDRYLTQLEAIEKEAAELDTLIANHAYHEQRVRLLMTLPGVDMAVALGLMAALGDPSRFASAHKAAAYFGLVPSTKQSGRHCYHGRITKQGNSHARWLLKKGTVTPFTFSENFSAVEALNPCMARTKRVVAVGCPHHITQRGNYRQDVFFSEQDRSIYLSLLASYAADYDLRLLGYCLMTNHVHLIAVPGQPDSLARAVGRAHNDYSRWFNIKNHRAGHLWQNRFYSCPLDPSHLAHAMRYVELNPARAEITASPVDYQWSSARAHCGLESPPTWLDTAHWSARYSPQQWQEALALDFRLAGDLDRLRAATRTGRPYGTDQFIAQLEEKLDRRLFPAKRGRKPKQVDSEQPTNRKQAE